MCQSPLNAGACAGVADVSACATEPSNTAPSAAESNDLVNECLSARIAADLIDVIPGTVIGHLQERLRITPGRVELAGRLVGLYLIPRAPLEVVGANLRHHR